MMKSVRSRLTVTFIGLIAVILAVIWGVNKWYLEDFYVTKKVQALNAMYTAIDAQIAENKDNGITIEEAMERDRDANGNITEGNLQRLIRNFSDSANVSVLIIDNSTEDATVYSTSRDTKFLKDRVDRYIFGWAKAKYTILEENEQYKIQKTYDPQRESMYLESWGFFTDNSTAFIMSAPLSSVGESVRLANQFLLYVGIIAAAIGGLVIYLTARQISKPIYRLSNLSERMSNLDFEAKYEPEKHEMEEIQVLGNSMNTLSERLEETICREYRPGCVQNRKSRKDGKGKGTADRGIRHAPQKGIPDRRGFVPHYLYADEYNVLLFHDGAEHRFRSLRHNLSVG